MLGCRRGDCVEMGEGLSADGDHKGTLVDRRLWAWLTFKFDGRGPVVFSLSQFRSCVDRGPHSSRPPLRSLSLASHLS